MKEFQNITKLKATANPFQTFHETHTAPNTQTTSHRLVPLYFRVLFSSVPKVDPLNPLTVDIQIYAARFVARNYTVRNLWWNWSSKYYWIVNTSNWCTHDFYYQKTTFWSGNLKSVAQNWHTYKALYIELLKLVFATSSTLQKWFFCCFICFQKMILVTENHIICTIWNSSFNERETEKTHKLLLKVQNLVEKWWCNESAATNNPRCNEIFPAVLPEKLKSFARKTESPTYIQRYGILYSVS